MKVNSFFHQFIFEYQMLLLIFILKFTLINDLINELLLLFLSYSLTMI